MDHSLIYNAKIGKMFPISLTSMRNSFICNSGSGNEVENKFDDLREEKNNLSTLKTKILRVKAKT